MSGIPVVKLSAYERMVAKAEADLALLKLGETVPFYSPERYGFYAGYFAGMTELIRKAKFKNKHLALTVISRARMVGNGFAELAGKEEDKGHGKDDGN